MTRHGSWRIWVGGTAALFFVYYFQPTYWWRNLALVVFLIFCRRQVLSLAEDFLFWVSGPLIRKFYDDPLSPFNLCYGSFVISEIFTGKTAGGFKVGYSVDAVCERAFYLRFKRAGLVGLHAQRALVRDFTEEVILPQFAERQYCFGLELGSDEELAKSKMEALFRTPIIELIKADGTVLRREVADSRVSEEFAQKPLFRKHGCNVRFQALHHDNLPDELIEENYAMLSDEQKKSIETDPRFSVLEERMAVAALKRRLDFVGRQSNQRHEADMFSIETEKVGRSVRIRWKLKAHAPEGYELVGFGKTGGYFADQFNMQQNGAMIAQSRRDGEAMEPLKEGEPTFYTFFLVSLHPSEDGRRTAYSPLRFRLTVSTKDETEAIESLLKQLDERNKPDPDREHITRMLKDVNLAVEYHEAIEEMKKSLEEKIRRKKLPPDEEERQLEIIDDLINTARSKHDI